LCGIFSFCVAAGSAAAVVPGAAPLLDRFAAVGSLPNWYVMQLLDLPDGHRTIRAIQNSFDETALRVAGAVGKLWHRARNYF